MYSCEIFVYYVAMIILLQRVYQMFGRCACTKILFFVSICLAVLGFAKPSSAETNVSVTSPAESIRVLLMGDSLSAGYGLPYDENWVSMLAAELARQKPPVIMINDSISGDTTANGLARLPDALVQYQPDWVFLALGANDGLRGLSLPAMQNNIREMIVLSRQAGAKVALIGMDLPQNYGVPFRQAFAQVFATLAETFELPLLSGDAFSDIVGQPDYSQTDGLHPNVAAQPKIYAIMLPFWQSVLIKPSEQLSEQPPEGQLEQPLAQ